MLEGIGLTVEQEEIYLGMLARPPRAMDEIAAAHPDRDREGTVAVVAGLLDAGLATKLAGSPERYLAVAPDVALEGLARARIDQAEHVRQAVPALMEQLWVASDQTASADFIEILNSETAFVRRWNQLMRTAKHQVRGFDRPPYYKDPTTEPNAEELERLSEGVVCRAIYAQAAVDMPGRWADIEAGIAAGEQARVLPELPAKMVLYDDTTATLATQSDPAGPLSVIIVHRSPLLDALSALFEAYWQQAIPITIDAAHPVTTDAREEQLVRLLAAGLGDDVIQRTLGVSASTVHRRIRHLMRKLGAQTRFQAGYQLARARQERPRRRPPDE
ncbi:LuxR C-terminal-related transcriptional regulator [Catenulispora rubra]|uniref:LuxR C-terminal-related transcriptional regulator n=1 Tax=Catenulispora rubra TaxID=280293 RepID=UPI00189210BB|nr:helix-turn-helix transcriptional regulator [Catenulispora rubra]